MTDVKSDKMARGTGRGSKFFALGHDVWATLQTVPTSNRLRLILVYLVLLAGTGSDHRFTKWSAKACDEHLGLGKPRAKKSIEELIEAGLIKHTASSTRMSPQYELAELPRDAEAIFLPVQIVTGLNRETPILRRIREAGDPLLLIMLIDLYAAIETDATYGVPIDQLRQRSDEPTARKISEAGVHTVWGLMDAHRTEAWRVPWVEKHLVRERGKDLDWEPLWERLNLLKRLGAIWWEHWVFDGQASDAEPMMPINLGALRSYLAEDDEARLTLAAYSASLAIVGDRSYLMDSSQASIFLPLPGHHQQPALRGVLRLRVEADTPGRRRSYGQRRRLIEAYQEAFVQVLADAENARFDRPLRPDFHRMEAQP